MRVLAQLNHLILTLVEQCSIERVVFDEGVHVWRAIHTQAGHTGPEQEEPLQHPIEAQTVCDLFELVVLDAPRHTGRPIRDQAMVAFAVYRQRVAVVEL